MRDRYLHSLDPIIIKLALYNIEETAQNTRYK